MVNLEHWWVVNNNNNNNNNFLGIPGKRKTHRQACSCILVPALQMTMLITYKPRIFSPICRVLGHEVSLGGQYNA